MRVQHPEKTQYEIAPAGEPTFLTDERGIADVSPAIGKNLVKQGWTQLKTPKNAADKPEPESIAPAVVSTDDVVVEED